jgi:hypothetical protein
MTREILLLPRGRRVSVLPDAAGMEEAIRDLLRELIFFNTFEELNLPIKGPMEY